MSTSAMPIKRPRTLPRTAPHDTVAHALEECVVHPRRNVFLAWSWKAAAISAILRSLIFLFTDRHTGHADVLRAMAVEASFSLIASGLLGALTQRLRDTRPLWLTALLVWIAMPVVMVATEGWWHHLFHTPHLRNGLAASFVFAAIGSGYTWFAMRQGILLQGVGDDSLPHDLRRIPRVTADFILWPFRFFRTF